MPVFQQQVFADEAPRDPHASGSNASAAQVPEPSPEVHSSAPADTSPLSPVPPEPVASPKQPMFRADGSLSSSPIGTPPRFHEPSQNSVWICVMVESQVDVLRENYEVIVLGPGSEPGTVRVTMSAKL